MSLWDQSQLAHDEDFTLRVTACVSNEDHDLEPTQWANDHRWRMASAPGFAAAYSSAIAGDVPNPGRDEAVIADTQILAAVQAVLAEEGATP